MFSLQPNTMQCESSVYFPFSEITWCGMNVCELSANEFVHSHHTSAGVSYFLIVQCRELKVFGLKVRYVVAR